MESSKMMATHSQQSSKPHICLYKAMWRHVLCCFLLVITQGCQGGRGYHGASQKRHASATDAILVGFRSAMNQYKKAKSLIPATNMLLPSSSTSSSSLTPSMTTTRYAISRPEERQMLQQTETAYLIRSQSPQSKDSCSTRSNNENGRQYLQGMAVPCASPSRQVSQRNRATTCSELDCLEQSLNRHPRNNKPISRLDEDDDKDIAQVSPVATRYSSITRRSTIGHAKSTTTTTTPTKSSSSNSATTTSATAMVVAAAAAARPLLFWENMVCGAISRSIAQTVMHPANTMKTILQSSSQTSLSSLMQPSNFRRLTQGAGANFVLSVPHGAINFAVLELVRHRLQKVVNSVPALKERADVMGPGLDFLSSAISTICCSIVSTPQMMICDNIMAGNYNNLPQAARGLMKQRGILGFYAGWWPGLVGKIPSYALTWTFFQQLKKAQFTITQRPAHNIENSIMGCVASAATVTIMIPMDTIKTRLVSQTGRFASTTVPYKGIIDCATRMLQEEGIGAFYRGLPPRLISVVPMIGIQFGVYEAMRRVMIKRAVQLQEQRQHQAELDHSLAQAGKVGAMQGATTLTIPTVPHLEYGRQQVLEEALMEVAADENQPFPAPHFLIKVRNGINGVTNGNGKAKLNGNKAR